MATFQEDLIKLGSTNPELREHIRPLLEASTKTAGRGASIATEIKYAAAVLARAQQAQDVETSLIQFYAILKAAESYSYFVLGMPSMRVLLAKAADILDKENDGLLSSGQTTGAPTV
jgi:hypothetical protein